MGMGREVTQQVGRYVHQMTENRLVRSAVQFIGEYLL